MKTFLVILATAAISIFVTRQYAIQETEAVWQGKGLDIAQNSFEYGCYTENKFICSQARNDIERSNCYEQALKACPIWASQFRDWIERKGQ